MNFMEQVELVHALLAAHQHEEALPPYRNLYQHMTRDIVAQALQINYLIEIPGEAYMDLYIGESKYLGAYKVGISQNAIERTQSIRSTNARNRNGNDYELLRFMRGPALAVRDAERRLKAEYAHMAVMGTEWISSVADDFFDAVWIEQDHLLDAWEKQMREHDALAALHRGTGAFRMMVDRRVPDHIVELQMLSDYVKKWDKVYGYVQDCQRELQK